jgi:hypothetical protein
MAQRSEKGKEDDRGDEMVVQAGKEGIRFLPVSGKPLEEPVAWYGPIVMNTQAELRQAYAELEEGTFLNPRGGDGSPVRHLLPHTTGRGAHTEARRRARGQHALETMASRHVCGRCL